MLHEPKLDEYFLHDRTVRESGHDTTYRLEKCCANLGTINLQFLLYKYEVDIATAIRDVSDELELEEDFDLAPFPPSVEAYANPHRKPSRACPQTSAEWVSHADLHREAVGTYFWNESKSLYFDYDTVQEKQSLHKSSTTFWLLWASPAGCASEEQGWKLMCKYLCGQKLTLLCLRSESPDAGDERWTEPTE